MKPKYRNLQRVVKDDGFRIQDGLHICGVRMLVCQACGRVFCPDCDQFFNSAEMPGCCHEAIRDYAKEADAQAEEKEDRAERTERLKRKRVVHIEEIGHDL